MARPALLVGVVVIGLGVGGCAAYRVADLPWEPRPEPGEFNVRSDMHEGDRVRVTTQAGEVAEGILLECDANGVTVAEPGDEPRLLVLTPADVRSVEVSDTASQRGLATAGIVVVSAALTALILDEVLEDDTFDEDWAPMSAVAR